jgi:hypothetical protein
MCSGAPKSRPGRKAMGMLTAAYGLLVFAAGAFAWGSRAPHLQKLALILISTWAASNVAVTTFGFDRAMYIQPQIDALAAVAVASVGAPLKSRAALVVALFFVPDEFVHAIAAITTLWGGYFYYATLNVIFALQTLIVGGAGALRIPWGSVFSGGRRTGAGVPGR